MWLAQQQQHNMRKKANRSRSSPSAKAEEFIKKTTDALVSQICSLEEFDKAEFEWTTEYIKPLCHHYGEDAIHLIHLADDSPMYSFHKNKIISNFTHEVLSRGNFSTRYPDIPSLKKNCVIIPVLPNNKCSLPYVCSMSEVRDCYGFTNTIMVPVHKAGRHCNNCGKEGEFKCDCCMSVWYCSERCQNKDMHKHFEVGEKINEVPPNQPAILIRSINSLKGSKPEYVPRVHPDPEAHEMLQWIIPAVSSMHEEVIENKCIIFKYEKKSDINTFKFHNNRMRFNCEVFIMEDFNFKRKQRNSKGQLDRANVCVLTPGEILFTGTILYRKVISPKVSVVITEHPGKSCNFCGKEQATKKCACCSSVYYCSSQCQKSDWSKHKALQNVHKDHEGLVLCLRIMNHS
jgi:hypothetical protein